MEFLAAPWSPENANPSVGFWLSFEHKCPLNLNNRVDFMDDFISTFLSFKIKLFQRCVEIIYDLQARRVNKKFIPFQYQFI